MSLGDVTEAQLTEVSEFRVRRPRRTPELWPCLEAGTWEFGQESSAKRHRRHREGCFVWTLRLETKSSAQTNATAHRGHETRHAYSTDIRLVHTLLVVLVKRKIFSTKM